MKLNELLDKCFKFDKRITEIGLKQNTLQKKEHQDYLNKLPDLSADQQNLFMEEEKIKRKRQEEE